jgi:ribosomal protein S18 acetylase RimI-like enzyme
MVKKMDGDMIRLVKMSKEYFDSFYNEYCIKELAKQSIENGMWNESEAYIKAKEEQEMILDQGIDTDGNYLYTIFDEKRQENIGEIWFGELPDKIEGCCYLYDIHIDENRQKQGYGTLAMKELEKEVMKNNYKRIRLHVFKENEIAKNMYLKLGYKVFRERGNNLWMEKEVCVELI